ncbi:hypothetical protein PAB09_01160 [Corynebacterium sp. SCR221107]|uniref:hypothetical protein n=1 Tax=Corynebacterium sp. SCR221107 TaxID=3017361 RepID=UPI0022EC251A|nr:hypothetical protein [Corynebacterium sp. SCR221107]WBT08991.1 hypothetical protein PAB09_01160 [Corynebacterium sp. SCR221107]
MNAVHSTRREAIEVEIIGTIAPNEDAFDVEAIADEVLETVGAGISYGYRLRRGLTPEEFWAIVETHALDQ